MKALVGSGRHRIHQVVANGGEFPVALPLRWIDAPENVTTRWSYDGERFIPPQPEPQPDPPQPTTVERLIKALERKGVLDPGEVDRS